MHPTLQWRLILPVSEDLEDEFGPSLDDCAMTVINACAVGLVGGSIEDAKGNKTALILEIGQATERIGAAAQAIAEKQFLLTARAKNFICERPNLADTIMRLQVYSEAGADMLYAPGLPDLGAIRTVCAEVEKPVNVLMGLSGPSCSVQELRDVGVRRISVCGSFARAASAALRRAAQEVLEHGTFEYAKDAIPDAELATMMAKTKLNARS